MKFNTVLATTILALFAFVTLFPSGVFAAEDGNNMSFVGIKKNKAAKILDDFKDYQDKLLFEQSPFTKEEEVGLFDAERKINGIGEIIKRLQNTQSQYQDQKREITQEKLSLRATLKAIDETTEQTEKEITQTEENIAAKNRSIADYLQKAEDLKKKIDENKKAIMEYLAYLYSKGDLMYGDDAQIDIVKTILLNDGNLSDIISDMHYQSLLEQAGKNFIEIHRNLIKEYYYNTEQLKTEKVDILRMKRLLQMRKLDLESQRQYKEQLLSITQGKEALFNRYIMEKKQKEDALSARVTELENEYDGTFETIASKFKCKYAPNADDSGLGEVISGPKAKCGELRQFYLAEKNLRDYPFGTEETGNIFSWPVTPRYVSAYFHDENYYKSVGSEHEAIDIPAAQGTDIVAPAPGYVYYINPPVTGGYGFVVLKHADGFMTVYGHVSEVLANRFEFIPAGKVFAKSGGAPGTPGAGTMTSGAHLHFEIHKDRETIDPLRYLDTTYLRFESLDSKYRYKYIQDLKIRYGNRANTSKLTTFTLHGDTEIDRQKDLLSTYATSSFSDWNVWTEEAVSAKIDPSFLMCVGLAETGLGRHLKTGYNIGNIGNTDSGGTYEFASARDGIYWMGKTLNNAYLGKYENLSDLSRWGNKNGSIYASSSKNWHNNIVNCLSALKGRFIEDDYKFRLSPEEAQNEDVSTGSGTTDVQ